MGHSVIGDSESCTASIETLGTEAERTWPASSYDFLITTQAKRNLSSRSGIGGVLSAT